MTVLPEFSNAVFYFEMCKATMMQYVKTNKQKPQLNRFGSPEGRALPPCHDSRAQQEEERLLFFPGKDTAN